MQLYWEKLHDMMLDSRCIHELKSNDGKILTKIMFSMECLCVAKFTNFDSSYKNAHFCGLSEVELVLEYL